MFVYIFMPYGSPVTWQKLLFVYII